MVIINGTCILITTNSPMCVLYTLLWLSQPVRLCEVPLCFTIACLLSIVWKNAPQHNLYFHLLLQETMDTCCSFTHYTLPKTQQ